MKFLILTVLLLPVITFAQEGGEINIGDRTISYETSSENNGNIYYYQNNSLAASKHQGIWLVYEDDEVVYEAHDTDNNGDADTFLTLNKEGEVTEMMGDGVKNFERPDVVEFSDLLASNDGNPVASAQDDLVGDLSSIKIPGGNSYTWLILIVLGGGGYWWYRKKRKLK